MWQLYWGWDTLCHSFNVAENKASGVWGGQRAVVHPSKFRGYTWQRLSWANFKPGAHGNEGLGGQSAEKWWSLIPHLPSFHGFPRSRAWDKDSSRRIYLEGDLGKQKWERNECEIKGEERSHKVCHWCVPWGYRDNFTRTPEKHTECLLEHPVPCTPEGRRKDTYHRAGSHWV